MSTQYTELTLDLSLESDLDWADQRAQAEKVKAEGGEVFWRLDLGLFDRLPQVLRDEGQLQALCHGIEHFNNGIAKEFGPGAVSLYKGSGDFTKDFRWDAQAEDNLAKSLAGVENEGECEYLKQLFCRDVCIDYLELLHARLPLDLEIFLDLDLSHLRSPAQSLHFASKERFEHVNLVLREAQVMDDASVGILIPDQSHVNSQSFALLDQVIAELKEDGLSFRGIPESLLIMEWHGLDRLFVVEGALTRLGYRALQGFEAAGGELIYL